MQKRYIAICAAAAVSAAAQGAPGFLHEMPRGTNEKPLDTPYAEMAETFRNPFDKVQTGCYWYWMGGNISCDGVRKDLEAMKKAGIDRPYIGDIGGGGNKNGWGTDPAERAFYRAFRDFNPLNDLGIG